MAATPCRALSAALPNPSFTRSPPRFPLTPPFFALRVAFTSHRFDSDISRSRHGATARASMVEIVTPKGKGKVKVFDMEEDLAVSLAKYATNLAGKISLERDSFTVVLFSGSLVKSLRKLLEKPYIETVDWSKWHVFRMDERVVPKDHPDSNYLLACNEFLSKVVAAFNLV